MKEVINLRLNEIENYLKEYMKYGEKSFVQ